MARRKKKNVRKVRVAHELPKLRRIAIDEAMKAHRTEDRPDWDRSSEWGDIRFNRKRIKPGTLRTIHLPLLNVSLGDAWPFQSPSSTSLPRPVHHHWRDSRDELTAFGLHAFAQHAFTDEGKPLDPNSLLEPFGSSRC